MFKNLKRRVRLVIVTSLIGVCNLAISAESYSKLDLSQDRISVSGAYKIFWSASEVSFLRHKASLYDIPNNKLGFRADVAKSNSGIQLKFRTNSSTFSLTFNKVPGRSKPASYGVFENGSLVDEITFSGKQNVHKLDIRRSAKSEYSDFAVTLPSLANVKLVEISTLENSDFQSTKEESKTYIALGDSITHGVGQNFASHLTYPFLLSKALDMELYNLAVGGSRLSLGLLDTLDEYPSASVVTLLIGYNDWNQRTFLLEDFLKKYEQAVKTILNKQPTADIFIITPLYTKRAKAAHTSTALQTIRESIEALIEQYRSNGNSRLHLIKGDQISSAKNLRKRYPKDPVHLGVEGAELLSKQLAKQIGSSSL